MVRCFVTGGGVKKDKFDSKVWLVMLHHGIGPGALKKDKFDSKA